MVPFDFSLRFKNEDGYKKFLEFQNQYSIQNAVIPPPTKIHCQIPKNERKCRYCGKKGNETKWKGNAHLIPELLGNRYLFAWDECFNCNQFFGKRENNLANFFGIARAINEVSGKQKVPKFKSNDHKIVGQWGDFFKGRSFQISKSDIGDPNIKVDLETGYTTIEIVKNTYTPLDVYKSFIKIGYGILPDLEHPHYGFTKDFLFTSKFDPQLPASCPVIERSSGFGTGIKLPMVWLFKKIHPSANIPTHMVMLFWQNYSYQFYLPFHSQDIRFAKGGEFTIPICPPFSFWEDAKHIPINSRLHDLSSSVRCKDERDFIVIQANKPDEPLVAYNPETKEYSNEKFDPSKIMGIHMISEDDEIV